MTANELTQDDRAALVNILQRAARRGREIREQNETATGGNLAGETPIAAGTSALQRSVHGHGTPVSGMAQIGEV